MIPTTFDQVNFTFTKPIDMEVIKRVRVYKWIEKAL